jgi:hypothetical protein
MSSIADRVSGPPLRAMALPLQFVWHSWQRLTPRHWAVAGAIGLATAALGSLTALEPTLKMDWAGILLMHVANPLFAALCFFLAWAVADAGDDMRLARVWRVAIAVLVASLACSLMAYEVQRAAGVMDWIGEFFAKKGRAAPGRGTILLVDTLNAMILGGLIVAVVEVNLHRLRTQRAIEDATREQAGMARQLLESRLAAMQAQVEPQFLFDSLVDVQALYERDTHQGAGILDRLIAYLRVALPRLRESGSTVQAEVELVRAYLQVVAARHNGVPAAVFQVAPEAECERFYPMLLLPLVQRAIRLAMQDHKVPPQRVELSVQIEHAGRDDATLLAQLRIAVPGLCSDDDDVARVRERLEGLTDGQARLVCEETVGPQPGIGLSQFTLRLPHSLCLDLAASHAEYRAGR